MIYGTIVGEKLEIKKADSHHTHLLLRNWDQISSKQKNYSRWYQPISEGMSCKDIYSLVQKSDYPSTKCPFSYDPFKNYLYERNGKEVISSQKFFRSDGGAAKILLMKKFGNDENLLGLAFTFQDQITYVGIDGTFNICKEKVQLVIFTASWYNSNFDVLFCCKTWLLFCFGKSLVFEFQIRSWLTKRLLYLVQ